MHEAPPYGGQAGRLGGGKASGEFLIGYSSFLFPKKMVAKRDQGCVKRKKRSGLT